MNVVVYLAQTFDNYFPTKEKEANGLRDVNSRRVGQVWRDRYV